MNAKALVVPFAILVGVIAWLALRGGDEPVPQPTPTPTQNQPASGDGGTATPALGNAAVQTTPTVDATASEARLAAAGTADAKGNAASADAVVTGRLVDAAGTPRPGVELSLRVWPDFNGEPIEDLLTSNDLANRLKTTTRADGRFQFSIARNRNGELGVEVADLVMARNVPSIEGKKGDHDLGDVRALRSGSVAGVVHDDRGQPVPGVKVAVAYGALGFGGVSGSTTKDDGTFTLGKLTGGNWTLRTASGKFLPTTQELAIADEEQKTGIVLVVRPGNAIAGQVIDERGVGVADMKVGSKRRETSGGVEIERFSGDDAVATDANGYFTLSGLAEKTVNLRAFGKGHSSAALADVQVGTGNVVLRVERLGACEGVLVGGDGMPIGGSRVRVAGGVGDGDMALLEEVEIDLPSNQGTATTAADGTFRLEGVNPGAVTLSAKGQGHRPVRQEGVQVTAAQTTKGLKLVADIGAVANVTVVDDAGKPVAGAEVKCERAPSSDQGQGGMTFAARASAHSSEDHGGAIPFGGPERLGGGTTDNEGKLRIAGLPGGDLVVHATHAAFAPAKSLRLTTPKSGAVDASLALRTPGDAEIVVVGTDGAPIVGIEVEVKGTEGDDKPSTTRVKTGTGGLAKVGQLAPGAYEAALVKSPVRTNIGNAMSFVAGDAKTMAASKRPFTIVAGQTAQIEIRRPVLTRVHGVVRGSDGPLAGCAIELAAGDDDGFAPAGFGSPSMASGGDGTFAFDDVEPGRYEIRFGKTDQMVKATEEIEVPADAPELRQDLQLRVGSVRVQTTAIGSTDPVEKAEVELVRTGKVVPGAPPRRQQRVMMMSLVTTDTGGGDSQETTTMTMGNQRAFTDEDGIAVIEDVPVGDYTVSIRHKKFAPKEVAGKVVVERQVTDCGRVELSAAGQIRGRVLDSNGKTVRMAIVQTCPIGTDAWGEPTMAQGGAFRVTGLAPGKHRVRAQEIGMTQGAFSEPIEVEVKGGDVVPLDVQVPAK